MEIEENVHVLSTFSRHFEILFGPFLVSSKVYLIF